MESDSDFLWGCFAVARPYEEVSDAETVSHTGYIAESSVECCREQHQHCTRARNPVLAILPILANHSVEHCIPMVSCEDAFEQALGWRDGCHEGRVKDEATGHREGVAIRHEVEGLVEEGECCSPK